MSSTGLRGWKNGLAFFLLLLSISLLEYYGQIFEQGIGHYLKWQNPKRPQLGRIWETERENLTARRQVKSLLSSLSLKERSSESIKTLKGLFQSLDTSSLVTRQKFLRLYFDYPGQWSYRIISPYDLVRIDSEKNWDRVLLNRSGHWITVSFIDKENFPVHEIFLSTEILFEVESTHTIKRGFLEEAHFRPELIFPIAEFLPLLETLDPVTQKKVFPDPQWFLLKDYHVTRVGVSTEPLQDNPLISLLGIEYETDFFTDVLLIPVPLEIANNMLSLMEISTLDPPDESPEL